MKQFEEIVRRAGEERRKLEQKLTEAERFASESPYAAAAHFTMEALYWRRIWRRRFRKLVKRFGGHVVARDGKTLLVKADPQGSREGFSFLCASG